MIAKFDENCCQVFGQKLMNNPRADSRGQRTDGNLKVSTAFPSLGHG